MVTRVKGSGWPVLLDSTISLKGFAGSHSLAP